MKFKNVVIESFDYYLSDTIVSSTDIELRLAHANENCPVFSGQAKVIHVGFEDPPKLAIGLTDKDEILRKYRRVRDEIEIFITNLEQFITN